jgi:hypothetical protein
MWVWKSGERQRRALFVQPGRRRLTLSADGEAIGELRLYSESDAAEGAYELQALSEQGWKFRSRALTTTLFTRLCLSDLFVHGIGGAKYDELTDRLMERFYGMPPPAFVALTGTLHLPLPSFSTSQEEIQRLQRRLRDLRFNADRVLSGADIAPLRARKQQVLEGLARSRAYDGRADRRATLMEADAHLGEIRSALRPIAAHERSATREALAAAERQLAANRVLQSREYAWCLYPEGELRRLMERVVGEVAAAPAAGRAGGSRSPR